MTKLPAILIVVSLALIAWIVYWGRGMPTWALVMSVSMVLIVALLVWAAAPRPSKEALLAKELAAMSDVMTRQGKIVEMAAVGEREAHALKELRLSLLIALDGVAQPVRLQVMVQDVLLPTFGTGSTVHVLQDPRSPDRLAIDRRKTPTHVV